jgi:PAS domain S-box-containing protein
MASGVMAVKLSTSRPDYLLWFRKEQLQSVTWAGDPHTPPIGDSPLELSPRRSFAAWSEIVRGTALPWTGVETALARAVGVALVDIIVQVEAVRLLLSEQQLVHMRAAVKSSRAAVAVANADGDILYASEAFWQLFGTLSREVCTFDTLAEAFLSAPALRNALHGLGKYSQSWKGEGALRQAQGEPIPLAIRAEAVLGRDGRLVGFVVTFADQTDSERATSARRQLERSLLPAGRDADDVIRAILTNASLAAMDIADGQHDASAAPQLQEVEQSTHRAASLYGRIRSLGAMP